MYQLRGGTPNHDTGELLQTEDGGLALKLFVCEPWWKLSFDGPDGRRIRLVKVDDTHFEKTFPDEWVKDAQRVEMR